MPLQTVVRKTTRTDDGSRLGKLSLPAILATGVVLGIVLSSSVPPEIGRRFSIFPFDLILRTHIVFAVVQIVLIVALLAIYLRFYAHTKSNFDLGLVIVIAALFLYSVFSNPLVNGLVGYVPFGSGYFELLPDFFLILAYSVFLYLSLE
jgi:hypothetical protein